MVLNVRSLPRHGANIMIWLLLTVLLPVLTVGDKAPHWDPRYARVLGIPKDGGPDLRNGGNQNDGRWDCPWQLSGTNCKDGTFYCKCPGNGAETKFTIGCCYHFPKCGNICNRGWSCSRYRRCNTCKSRVSEWDKNACASCKKGYVYQNGLCDKDLNECATRNGGCEQKCTNTYGSYYCSCHDGFSLESNKHSCKRLSCPRLTAPSGVTVTPTESWMFASFAKFKTTVKTNTLDGPYIRECQARSGTNTFWENITPSSIDTCSVALGAQCREDGIGRDKCIQLGCCYSDVGYGPSCFFNRAKTYVRYGGVSPTPGDLSKRLQTFKNYDVGSCSYKCLSYPGQKCKSFGINNKGRNITHDVMFQDCHLLPKTKPEYTAVSNKTYDMYDFLPAPSAVPSKSTNADPLVKQYVGCFKESADAPDLPHHVATSDSLMDVRMCVDMCRLHRFSFAGVQNGKDCSCGNDLIRKYGPSTDCTVDCPGDKTHKCGGTGVNSVYRVSWSDAYVGCYKDNKSSRDLSFFVWNLNAGRPASECIKECSKHGYVYAGIQNGGDCYCGNAFGTYGGAAESSCYQKCGGYARQNCGGTVLNAIYNTELAVEFGSSNIDSRVTRFYDTTGQVSGISTSIFTLYPKLRTILSKRLIIHTGSDVMVPAEASCSNGNCYKPCGEIYHDERLSNKGSDVTLRFFYVKLSEIPKYIGSVAERVSVYAETAVIDADLKFDFALSVRTKDLIVDRSRAYFIDIASTAKGFDINIAAEKLSDPEPELLQQKQSIMCARMLFDTKQQDHVNTAFSVLNDIAMTSSKRHEARALATSARNLLAEVVGLQRNDISYVPFYKKSHLADILDTYYTEISIYQRKLNDLVEKAEGKEEVLDFVEGLHKIYSETDILEAETAHEAAVDAVSRSNATYLRFTDEYELARKDVENARVAFEKGLKEKEGWEISKLLIKFLSKTSKAIAGQMGSDDDEGGSGDKPKTMIEDDTFDSVFELLEEVTALVRQINDLAAIADQVINAIEDIEGEYNGMKYIDDLEMTVQLESNVIKWINLKNYAEAILADEEVASVRGCPDYHRALLDLCNWGEAVTNSMIERAELMREASEKRTVLDLKKEQKSRIDDHIEDFRDDLFSKEALMAAMIEQSYDVRLDLNDALLTFCQAYFYENMYECSQSYKPSFGGTMNELLLKVNAARRDDLLVGTAPSTLKRYITIKDTSTDPMCGDPVECPIKYLRENRMLYFKVPVNHEDLKDMDAYKVTELILTFNGVASTTDNKYLKILIESSGKFQGQANKKTHNFMTRALSLAFEYNIDTLHTSVHADVYQPFRNIIQHITPFTTWVMRVSDARSRDIDLSKVTSVRVQFDGSAIDNETWKRKYLEVHGNPPPA